MRFLIADDDPVHRTVLGRMIERLGFAVDVVQNGSEAVASVLMQDYDVVLLDVYMPSMDGIETVRAIRNSQTVGNIPYVIGLSAGTEAGLRDECLGAGMDAFLVKPARIETIRDLVASIPNPSGDSDTRPHAWSIHEPKSEARDTRDADEPVIDLDVLRRFRSMMGASDEEFIRELEADFVQDAGTLAHAIERAGESDNHEAMARAAHALKSNSAMFGATRLSNVSRSIERLADAGLPHPWVPLHRRLVREIDEVRSALSSPDFSVH